MSDNLATAEDYLAAKFDAITDAEIPTWDDWEKQVELEFPFIVLGCASLRFSNQELAENVRKMGGVQQAGKLFKDLVEVEQRHRAIVDHLEAINARLLVAMVQAGADEAA